jgi:hypothetical protein
VTLSTLPSLRGAASDASELAYRFDVEHLAKLARRRKRRERARLSIDRILGAQPFHERKWFRLSELVDHYAKIPGGLLCDPSRKEEAFEFFRASIYRGEFGGSSGWPTRIRWIAEESLAPRWLSRDSAEPNGFLLPLIGELVISRADAAAWFRRHSVAPPHWFAEAHDGRLTTEAEKQGQASSGTSGIRPASDEVTPEKALKLASEQKIKEAIDTIYSLAEKSGTKPPNIKELPSQVRDLLARISSSLQCDI